MTLGKLAFLNTDVPANNKALNGGFSEGSSHWDYHHAEELSVEDGIVTFSATQSGVNTREHNIYQRHHLNYGEHYYLSGEINADSQASLYITRTMLGSISVFDEWERLSGIFISNINAERAIGVSSTEDEGGIIKVRRFAFINLTETFGAGNEPSAEQMDKLLEQFPNSWFDGTVNLFNAKSFINAYHKKMTELDNAIISLGGSS